MSTLNRHTLSRHVIICIMAFLVFGFSLGSLINFHLNRIYGNPLETELLFVKKDEKTVGNLLKVQTDVVYDDFLQATPIITECDYNCISLLSDSIDHTLISKDFDFGTGLRAPPLA